MSEPIYVPEPDERPDPALIAFIEDGLTIDDMEGQSWQTDALEA